MTARKILLAIGALLIAAYVYLAFIGIEPLDRRPGTRIAGIDAPLPADVGFVDEVDEITLETYPWYGVPFSITAVIVSHAGALYVPSLYDSPQAFPGTKFWNAVVERNPNVRLRVGTTTYRMTASPVVEDTEFAQVFQALGAKFPFWREQIELDGRLPRFALIKLSPRAD